MSPICRLIPEGTGILVPVYVLSRDPANFSPDPDVFWPDRWLHASTARRGTPKELLAAAQTPSEDVSVTSSNREDRAKGKEKSDEVVTNTSAFIPFSYGPENCAGRNLALVEMRMVVATLVQRFEMEFAEGYDPSKWEEDLKEFFLVKVGSLPVVLRARF